MTEKSYTLLDIKTIQDDEQRIIKGIATTQTLDRDGDIVEPLGAEFTLPIPFLWQHNREEPIGEVVAAEVSKQGIMVEIHIAKIEEAGQLKERIDMAWQTIKNGLVKGLSIGFHGREFQFINDGGYGRRFTAWDWHELSAVTIPANAEATIISVKQADNAKQPAQPAAKTVQPYCVKLSTVKQGVLLSKLN